MYKHRAAIPRWRMVNTKERVQVESNVQTTKGEEDLEKRIQKEVEKLDYYLEDIDKSWLGKIYDEIKQVCKRTQEIQDRLNNSISQLQELKIELGGLSKRSIRQWRRELKAKPLCKQRLRMCKAQLKTSKFLKI